jgi:hypothetical protein
MQAETPSKSETVESTTIAGLKFLDSLKQAKDKTYVLGFSDLPTSISGDFH